MNRRKAIALGSGSIALLSGGALTGCAATTTVVPEREPVQSAPLAPLASVMMLPVDNADFHVLDNRDIETNAVISDETDNKKFANIFVDRNAVDLFHLKMTALQMTVHKKFQRALLPKLQDKGLSMTPYSAADLAIAVRANGDIATLGAGSGTDAVIDVRVRSLGYRPISSAMAMTPESMVALKVARVSDSALLANVKYTFDWRMLDADPRHFRCDEGDLFSSVDAVMSSLPKVAAILDRGTMLMVDQVANDIAQIYRGNALS